MTDPPHAGGPGAGDEPGDPACWLDRLCPECGAMPSPDDDGAPPRHCWRCGADDGSGRPAHPADS